MITDQHDHFLFKESPHKCALINADERIDYNFLHSSISAYTKRLATLGLLAGDNVLIVSANSIDLILLILSCLKSNIRPLVQPSGGIEIDIKDLNPKYVFATKQFFFQNPTLCDQSPILISNRMWCAPFRKHTTNRFTHSDAWLFITSSGTTGKKKIIQLSKSGVQKNIAANVKAMGITETDITLIILTLAYGYGLIAQLLSHLYVGATIVLGDERFFPLEYPKLINKNKISSVYATPVTLRKCLYGLNQEVSTKFPSLKYISIGGAYAESLLIHKVREKFQCDIIRTYGMAEAGPRVSTRVLKANASYENTINAGLPLEQVNVYLRKDRRIPSAPANTKLGFIAISTPSHFLGYLGKRSSLSKQVSKIYSKDIGYFSADGSINIIGRKGEFISINNKTIWFNEIAEKIYATGMVLKLKLSIKGTILFVFYASIHTAANTDVIITNILKTDLNIKEPHFYVAVIKNKNLHVTK